MALKIVRNDITKMNTEAVVNTASSFVEVGPGCDKAVYQAAGMTELLAYRREKIGDVPEGEAFITPGFNLSAKYIIHAVSPLYINGESGEEEKLRSCYRRSLQIAKDNGIRSIAFPLISTGSFGYPKEEGMRIAVDEINAFLMNNRMDIYLVVFDDRARNLGRRIFPNLEEYIDRNYVEKRREEEYSSRPSSPVEVRRDSERGRGEKRRLNIFGPSLKSESARPISSNASVAKAEESHESFDECCDEMATEDFFESAHVTKIDERISHLSDTFSQYLMYLIKEKNMENAEVYKRAIVDKKIFSKIKNNIDYHPQKLTALCLCVGAKLNMDETKDLLARAGYALSPCDKTDIIFSYFIENEIYDMIELDIQLEEHGLPCIIA